MSIPIPSWSCNSLQLGLILGFKLLEILVDLGVKTYIKRKKQVDKPEEPHELGEPKKTWFLSLQFLKSFCYDETIAELYKNEEGCFRLLKTIVLPRRYLLKLISKLLHLVFVFLAMEKKLLPTEAVVLLCLLPIISQTFEIIVLNFVSEFDFLKANLLTTFFFEPACQFVEFIFFGSQIDFDGLKVTILATIIAVYDILLFSIDSRIVSRFLMKKMIKTYPDSIRLSVFVIMLVPFLIYFFEFCYFLFTFEFLVEGIEETQQTFFGTNFLVKPNHHKPFNKSMDSSLDFVEKLRANFNYTCDNVDPFVLTFNTSNVNTTVENTVELEYYRYKFMSNLWTQITCFFSSIENYESCHIFSIMDYINSKEPQLFFMLEILFILLLSHYVLLIAVQLKALGHKRKQYFESLFLELSKMAYFYVVNIFIQNMVMFGSILFLIISYVDFFDGAFNPVNIILMSLYYFIINQFHICVVTCLILKYNMKLLKPLCRMNHSIFEKSILVRQLKKLTDFPNKTVKFYMYLPRIFLTSLTVWISIYPIELIRNLLLYFKLHTEIGVNNNFVILLIVLAFFVLYYCIGFLMLKLLIINLFIFFRFVLRKLGIKFYFFFIPFPIMSTYCLDDQIPQQTGTSINSVHPYAPQQQQNNDQTNMALESIDE